MQNVLTRNQMIASAAGTLEALEILGNAGGQLSLRELVATMRRPKATVHRMLSTLVSSIRPKVTRAVVERALIL